MKAQKVGCFLLVAVLVLIGFVSCNKSVSAEDVARSTGTVEINQFTGDIAKNNVFVLGQYIGVAVNNTVHLYELENGSWTVIPEMDFFLK